MRYGDDDRNTSENPQTSQVDRLSDTVPTPLGTFPQIDNPQSESEDRESHPRARRAGASTDPS